MSRGPKPRLPWAAGFVPVLVGTLFAAAAEGVMVARGGADIGEVTLGLLAGGGVLFSLLLPAAFFLGWLGSRPSTIRWLTDVARGMGADVTPAAALMAGGLALGGAVAAALWSGWFLLDHMTPRFAMIGEAVALAAVAPLLFLTTPGIARLAARLAGRIPHRRLTEFVPGVSLVLMIFSLAVYGATASLLPGEWGAAPTAAAAGIFAASLPAVRQRLNHLFSTTAARAGVLAAFAASVALLLCLESLPPSTRRALLRRAPYDATLLGGARSLFDLDGDGFSGRFLGGDCDDWDPHVNPLARDIPGNGRDEDCSGEDSKPYVPIASPRYPRPEKLPERMNIVLVLMDALRPDHLSFFGYPRRTAPRLERFRKEAVVFDRAYTPAPETRSAMVSLFTGLDAREASVRRRRDFRLNDAARTVAERLKEIGYRTVGLTISYVMHHIQGMGQGFDVWKTPWPADEWRKIFGKAAGITTDAALAELEKMPRDAPYLLFTHYRCNHDPYIGHKAWPFGDRPVDRYDSATAYCDQQIARLLKALEQRADRRRTAVFIFSDHGELFGEHGFTNHGNSLYEPDVRILLMARIPTVRPRRISAPVLLTDLAPTVLELAGQAPEGMTSWSLLTHLFAGRKIPNRSLFLYTDLKRGGIVRDCAGVLRWPFKYIRDRQARADELYDVEADPKEESNLITHRLADYVAMKAELERFRAYLARK